MSFIWPRMVTARRGDRLASVLETLVDRRVCSIKRIVFREITEQAILEAAENLHTTWTSIWSTPRKPGASWTGCAGFEVDQVLWKKVAPKLSAGRVQSVATRIIVLVRTRPHGVPQRRLLGRGGESWSAQRVRP